MARTTPVSNGWMTLVRLLGMILPVADATMSMVPYHAQASAAENIRMRAKPMARPTGDGGVSTISSAAGRKASSSGRLGLTSRRLVDVMDASLQAVQ